MSGGVWYSYLCQRTLEPDAGVARFGLNIFMCVIMLERVRSCFRCEVAFVIHIRVSAPSSVTLVVARLVRNMVIYGCMV